MFSIPGCHLLKKTKHIFLVFLKTGLLTPEPYAILLVHFVFGEVVYKCQQLLDDFCRTSWSEMF